jgi:hypothetical protein
LQPSAKPRAAEAPVREIESQRRQWVRRELLGEEDLDYYLSAFHRHYEETYADANQPFDAYEPACYLRYELAVNPGHREREWEDVQAQARQDWEETHERAWQDVKQAVIFSWTQVKRALAASEQDGRLAFRAYFEQEYGSAGRSFDAYQPAFAYGYVLAQDPDYRGRDWNEVKSEARRHWEKQYDGAWEDFRETIRKGRETARSRS